MKLETAYSKGWAIEIITKRMHIPNTDGKERPLGVPDLESRILLWKLNLLIKKTSEHHLGNFQHGFRKGRSYVTAWLEFNRLWKLGYRNVYEFDLKACFNRISILKLIEDLDRMRWDRRLIIYLSLLCDNTLYGRVKEYDP